MPLAARLAVAAEREGCQKDNQNADQEVFHEPSFLRKILGNRKYPTLKSLKCQPIEVQIAQSSQYAAYAETYQQPRALPIYKPSEVRAFRARAARNYTKHR